MLRNGLRWCSFVYMVGFRASLATLFFLVN